MLSFRQALVISALAAALLPNAAHAEETLICLNNVGEQTFVTLDPQHKRVSLMSGTAPARCIADFVAGAIGPVFTAPPGEYCIKNLMGETKAAKFVAFGPKEIKFGTINEQGVHGYLYNKASGLMTSEIDTEECHRPKA